MYLVQCPMCGEVGEVQRYSDALPCGHGVKWVENVLEGRYYSRKWGQEAKLDSTMNRIPDAKESKE